MKGKRKPGGIRRAKILLEEESTMMKQPNQPSNMQTVTSQ